MVRVNEIDQHLVSDIIVGYYNRQNFRDSQLLADRHSMKSKTRSSASSHRVMGTNDSDSTNNSDPEEDVRNVTPHAASDGLCFPLSVGDGGRELVPPLHLRTSGMAVGATRKPSKDFAVAEDGGGEIMTLTLAERRRERRRERQQAHQERLRRKDAERESERRRMRADKALRDREVARAVREAEDAERVRLLREAQEAEDAAPVAARLIRTMQRKAAGAVAAAKSRAGAGADVVAATAGSGSSQRAMATGTPADDGPFRRERGEENHQQTQNGPEGEDLPVGRRPSQVTFDNEMVQVERSAGGSGLERGRRSNDGDGGNLGGTTMHVDNRVRKAKPPADENKLGEALTNDSKKGRHRPKKGSPSQGKDDTSPGATTPPLSRARERAAAAAAPTDALKDREGAKATSDVIVMSAPAEVATLQAEEAGGDTDVRRRKPSQERVGEPRAVFMHRASIVPSSIDAPTSGEAARGEMPGSVTGEEAGAIHQRRQGIKGRVGSVLPT